MVTPFEFVPGVWRMRHGLNNAADGHYRIEQEHGYEHCHDPGTYRLFNLPPERPDILHMHNLHGYYFDLRALPWLSRRVPVIVNLRDGWLLGGHCACPIECERWRTGCGDCPHLDGYPAVKRDATAVNWQRRRAIFARSRLYVTAPSQWLMDRAQASTLNGVEYRMIPNGIDLTVFNPGNRSAAREALALPQDAHIVLLSSHSKFMDYPTMETALARLRSIGRSPLLFICLGSKAESRRIGEGQIVSVPVVEDAARLAQYYRASDVFLLAKKYEAFGKMVAEAMACGTPVVATAVGGIPEIVEDGTSGYLTPQADSGAMAEAVQRLLQDAALRTRMGAAAAQRARQFALEKQVDAFMTWYREILDHNDGKPQAFKGSFRKGSAE
jgi:glycosyltransferase involved in cell wall biosynthesis